MMNKYVCIYKKKDSGDLNHKKITLCGFYPLYTNNASQHIFLFEIKLKNIDKHI